MINTGAELWERWATSSVVSEKTYDAPLMEAIAATLKLPTASSFAVRLRLANTSAHALLSAVLLEILPFANMMLDLLELYTRIGAQSALGENLRIKIDAEAGTLHESLKAFRQTANRLQVVTAVSQDWLIKSPLCESHTAGVPASIGGWRTDHDADGSFGRPVPGAPATTSQALDQALRSVVNILNEHLSLTSEFAPDQDALRAWWSGTYASGHTPDPFYEHVMGGWFKGMAVATHQTAEAARNGELIDPQAFAEEIEAWLAAVPTRHSSVQRMADDIQDILSLPSWGKRYEIYSAWLVTQIDQALRGRLRYRVENGVFAMPFRKTRLADLSTSHGELALFSEFKSPLKDPVSAKRKGNVQPDYAFASSDSDNSGPLVIEAKQYWKGANKNPGEALADYTGAFPKAVVIVAAYGSLGKTVLSYVPADRLARASAQANVRPGGEGILKFRDAVDATIPGPPIVRASESDTAIARSRVTITWDSHIRDLDLQVYESDNLVVSYRHPVSTYGRLVQDAFDGGPEVVELTQSPGDPTTLRIVVHSYDETVSLEGSGLRVVFESAGLTWAIPTPDHFAPGQVSWEALTVTNGEFDFDN